MSGMKTRIEDNLRRIRERIASACAGPGRNPGDVAIVAVTKSADMEALRDLVEAGLTDLGESRVQQLVERAGRLEEMLGGPGGPQRVRWHMVGHLQRNKVKPVLEVCQVIHSIDTLRLAEEISLRAGRMGRSADVLMQVNCSEEAQKFGVAVGAATSLAEMICSLRHVRLVGLMTMAPLARDPEKSRPTFVRLRELFEEIRGERIGGEDFRHLSMGMSQDYHIAVEEGATLLRIGTALFE